MNFLQKFLPHYIGGMAALSSLFVNNNRIQYLPLMLKSKKFKDINIADNNFRFDREAVLRIQQSKPVLKKRSPESLCHLALYFIVKYNVKFERQDVNCTLWSDFNFIGRCKKCDRFIVIDAKNTHYKTGEFETVNYHQCSENIILWQFVKCPYACDE